jgi:hypothetical protein
MLPIIVAIALGVLIAIGLATRTWIVAAAGLAAIAFPIVDLLDVEPAVAAGIALAVSLAYGLWSRSWALTAIAGAALVAFALSAWLSIVPTALFAFAILVGVIKGRYVLSAVAFVVGLVLLIVIDATTGTANAGDVPFGDAWILVLVLLAGWLPALAAAAGEAAEGSLWVRSGRPRWATPIIDVLANFVWVFAIILLGILFDGAGILGAEIFCAVFAGLLAAVLLFGLGAARAQPA